MKKLFTLTIMALVLMMTNLAWGQTRTTMELTFPLTTNPGGWPTTQSNELNNYVYTLNEVDYTFALKNVKCNNGYLMIYQVGVVGLPAIDGYKLITVAASNSNGCSTSVKVGISNSGTEANYIDGGDIQTWSTTGSTYTYNLTSTDVNTMYYLYVTNKNAQVTSLTLTYEQEGGTPSVATPTFSPAAGTYYEAQNVTIACTTDEATIYYTLDGTDPTTESTVYSTPIAISETKTVKAMAAKEGMNNSAIASATYTIEEAPTPITIAEARALANNEYALVQGIVTFIDGRNVYVQDATAGIDLFLNNNTVPSALAIGDMVLAYGQKTVYNGLIELKNINGGDAEQFSIVSTGNELPAPVVKTIGEILTDEAGDKVLQSSRVQIVGATIGAINLNGNTAITQDEQSVNIYKIPAVEGLLENDIVTVTSVVARYNGNLQLRVAYATDVIFEHPQVETVATPTFTPEAGTYTEAQSVTIACATEGATIYYTLDGTDPTAESTVYAEPIAIAATTTVKAFAVKEGMNDSEIATALYTIEEPATPTAYTLITNNVALVPGDKYLIVGVKSDTIFKALGKQNTNNRAAVAVTPVENVISIVPATTDEGGVFELTLGQDSIGYWTLYDAVNGGYLYAAGTGSSNYLKTQAANDAKGQWTIEIADNGVATIKAPASGTTRNWIRYNDNSGVFSCYGSGQLDVYLYKAGDIPQPTYYTVSVAEGITNGTVTVNPESATEGATITVTATPAQGYELATLTYTYGETTNNIDPTTMQFVMPAANVTVNATFAEMASVATPTFTPAAGTYITTQYVTIACETEGATIYYTLDGTDPTIESTVYADSITISATTTVKAFAVKEGLNNSEIASATYTIVPVMTIAEAKALENNAMALVQAVVTFIDGRNVYVQDATAGIDLYLNSNTVPTTLAIGDMVMAYGKKTVYNGLTELTSINGGNENVFRVISTGNELPAPVVKTIAEILADEAGDKLLQSSRVQIVEAIIGTINLNGNTAITQGEQSVNIYKIPAVEGLLANDIVTVTSVVARYNGNLQLRVAYASDITFEHPVVQTVATPTFAPEAGTYYEAQNVTIACETEGATIYYTLDGSDPTVESAVYSAPIAIAETTTVKALAVKEGMNDSEIATAEYVITAAPTAKDYTLITHNVALVPGEKYLIVGIKYDTVYQAMSKQKSNNRHATDVNPVNNVISVIPSTTNDEGVFEFTLGQDSVGYWTLYDAVNGGYLFAPSSTANQLNVQATNDANGQWTISIDYNGMATLVAQGANTRNCMRYNEGSSLFSCYAPTSSIINKVYFFKAGEIPQPTYYAVNVAEGITNGTVTVDPTTAADGTPIAVTATPATGYELATLTYNYGTETFDIDQTTMQFVMPAADVTVNATFTLIENVATPTFAPEAGTYYEAQNVTIACETEGATIYYTLDGSDPTVESAVYAEPIAIAETTTVKAMAAKAGLNNSEIATAVYTITDGPTPITIAEARALANNEYALVQGVVTFIDGLNIYIQDETAGIDLYLNANTVPEALAQGDMVLAYGKKAVYKGLVELKEIDGTNPNEFSIVSNGNELPVAVKTIAEILADAAGTNMLQSTRVQIVEAIIGAINPSNNTPITQGESTMNIYKIPTVEGLLENDIVTVTGVIGCYNNPQLRIASAADVTFEHPQVVTVATPTFTPVGGLYFGPQNVTIVCATEEATIYYTLDGTDPTTASTVYTEPIAISETTTVKAFAVKEGLTDSEIATAVYTIEESSDWNRIYSAVDLHDGDLIIIASRYSESITDGYYAMPAEVTGKPNGVLFTSVTENNVERLPDTIANDANTYLWNVIRSGNVIKLVNAAGDTLGYNSSTNFSSNTNTGWYLDNAAASATALVPNYNGFTLINTEVTNRAVTHRNNEQYKCFGAYSTSNMTNANAGEYNFYLDFFVQGGSSTMAVSTPIFSMAAGTYFNEIDVEIMCMTEGATIYYTLDGTDPTTSSSVYNGSIHIAETKTLKAMGVKEGFTNSSIATAEYVIETAPSIITIAAAKLLEINEFAMVQGVVTFIDNRNVYIQDETAGIVLYLNANTVPEDLAIGDMVVAYGKRSVYNGLIELSDINGNDPDKFNIISSGNTLPLATVTIAEILADFAEDNMLQSTRVEIVESTIGAINNNGNTPITQDGSEINIYKMPAVEGLVEGDIVTFAGVIGCYNNPQMRIASADDIEFYHPGGDPTLTVSTNALSGFTYMVGNGPSAAQTFTVSGENLPLGFLTLAVNNSFEISLDGQLYTGTSITIPVDNPTLEPMTVYVRLNGQQVGQYNGTVTIEDDITATVTLSGTVTDDGVEETLASSVSVWNNVNEMMIENNSGKCLNVMVYNIIGQPVLNETITAGSNVIRHDLTEGVYIVRLTDGKNMTGIKVVVRR